MSDNSRKVKAAAPDRVSVLDALYRITHILSAGPNQKQSLAEVLDTLDNDLGMKHGMVTLLSPDRRQILVEVAHGFPEERRRKVRYQIGEGITGKVIQSGKPIIVPKISQEPSFLNRLGRSSSSEGETSFICVPIAIGQETIGTVSIDQPYQEGQRLPAWQRPLVAARQHADWGAELAEQAGASPLAVALIRRHQQKVVLTDSNLEDGLLSKLQAVDDQN